MQPHTRLSPDRPAVIRPVSVPPQQPRMLTVLEVASELRVDPTTVRRWIARGTLPALKVGNVYRVEAEQLEALRHHARTSTPLSLPPAAGRGLTAT